jgi:hypothetical protein
MPPPPYRLINGPNFKPGGPLRTVQFAKDDWDVISNLSYLLDEKTGKTDTNGLIKEHDINPKGKKIELQTIKSSEKTSEAMKTMISPDEELIDHYQKLKWTVCDRNKGGKGPIRRDDSRSDEIKLIQRMLSYIGHFSGVDCSKDVIETGKFDTVLNTLIVDFQKDETKEYYYAGTGLRGELEKDALVGPRTVLALGHKMLGLGVIPWYWFEITRAGEQYIVYVTLQKTAEEKGIDLEAVFALGAVEPRLSVNEITKKQFGTPEIASKSRPNHIIIRLIPNVWSEHWLVDLEQSNVLCCGGWPPKGKDEVMVNEKYMSARAGLRVLWKLSLDFIIDKGMIVRGAAEGKLVRIEPYSFPQGTFFSKQFVTKAIGTGLDHEAEMFDQVRNAKRFHPVITNEDKKIFDQYMNMAEQSTPFFFPDRVNRITGVTMHSDASLTLKLEKEVGYNVAYHAIVNFSEALKSSPKFMVLHWKEQKEDAEILDVDRYSFGRDVRVMLQETTGSKKQFYTNYGSDGWSQNTKGGFADNYENYQTMSVRRVPVDYRKG